MEYHGHYFERFKSSAIYFKIRSSSYHLCGHIQIYLTTHIIHAHFCATEISCLVFKKFYFFRALNNTLFAHAKKCSLSGPPFEVKLYRYGLIYLSKIMLKSAEWSPKKLQSTDTDRSETLSSNNFLIQIFHSVRNNILQCQTKCSVFSVSATDKIKNF